MAKFHPFIILATARTCLPQRFSDTQRSSACLAAMLRYLCCILNSSFLANQYSYPARLRRALALTPPCRLLIPLLYKSCFRAAAWSAAPARFTFWQLPRSPHQPINRKQGPPTPPILGGCLPSIPCRPISARQTPPKTRQLPAVYQSTQSAYNISGADHAPLEPWRSSAFHQFPLDQSRHSSVGQGPPPQPWKSCG